MNKESFKKLEFLQTAFIEGTDETNGIYEAFKENGPCHSSGMAIRKSFSEGNIKLFTKQNTFDADNKIQPGDISYPDLVYNIKNVSITIFVPFICLILLH